EFDQRADKPKRIIPVGFKETCESGVDIVGKGSARAVIDVLRRRGPARRPGPCYLPRLYSRGDIGLKIRDPTGRVRVPAVGAVAQALKQLLQQKQITEGKRLIVAAWRHVASNALKGDKDVARGAFEVLIELRRERRRPALGDRSCNASRMLIRPRGLWLGSVHHAASSNRAMLPSDPVSDSSKSVKSTTDFRDAATPIRRAISRVGTPSTNFN